MSRPTLLQLLFRRRIDRRRWAAGAAIVFTFAALWAAAGWLEQQDQEALLPPPAVVYSLSVEDPRVCAALAAYRLATGDHWDQRAAIARAALNRFQALGEVPDCGQAMGATLAAGLDPYLWQSSLDAVDAVTSGSYALPDACVRADTVSPAVTTAGPSLPAASARTHCVIADLAFYQADP